MIIIIIITIIIIIIQEMSIAYNPQPKARHNVLTERRKINTYIKTKIKQRRTNRAHHDYHTMDNHTIYEEKSAEQQPEKRWKALRLLTVPNIHTHITK